MTVSTSKTNYPKVRLLKTLRHSFVKILQPSQKRLNHDAFLTGTTKELSTMPKTFVYTAITVKKQMPVEKSCSAVLNVHPVQPATKPVRISKRNGAADLIRRLMYVMAVQWKCGSEKAGKIQTKKVPQNTDQRPRSIYQQNLCRLLFFGIKFLCTNGHSKVIKGLPENAVNHDLYRGKTVSCISY